MKAPVCRHVLVWLLWHGSDMNSDMNSYGHTGQPSCPRQARINVEAADVALWAANLQYGHGFWYMRPELASKVGQQSCRGPGGPAGWTLPS